MNDPIYLACLRAVKQLAAEGKLKDLSWFGRNKSEKAAHSVKKAA